MIKITNTNVSYTLNGHMTGLLGNSDDLVKTKILCAITSNHWCSTENNSNNSWNVNFNNGNLNNNNKYNSNVVRAVAALGEEQKIGWVLAYLDCCKHKLSSKQCTLYRAYSEDVMTLAAEIYSRTYKPTTSTCFCVTRPKLREVFASNFRDRVVQHWICLRLEPLFEDRFQQQGNVSYNCRKGFGTLAAVQKLSKEIEEVTYNYTRSAWIGKFDLKGFFMSIDCDILLEKLIPFIREKYKGDDVEDLIWATIQVVNNRPELNCEKRGKDLWSLLPPNKTLFGRTKNVGMPIGNLTSQLFANFYMSFFDELMIDETNKVNGTYIRFVDDWIVVCPNKKDVIRLYNMAYQWLLDNLHVYLHTDKVYIQHSTKGVNFVGSIIRPGRIYTINRTVGAFIQKIVDSELLAKRAITQRKVSLMLEFCKYVNGINSYMGFLVHSSSYAIRRKVLHRCHYMPLCCTLNSKYTIVRLKKNFKTYVRIKKWNNSTSSCGVF